jgi:hypothetical protein
VARCFEAFEYFSHAAGGAAKTTVELARLERIGRTGATKGSKHSVITRSEFEGFEDIVLEGIQEDAEPGEANEGGETRMIEIEIRIFGFPAASQIFEPKHRVHRVRLRIHQHTQGGVRDSHV